MYPPAPVVSGRRPTRATGLALPREVLFRHALNDLSPLASWGGGSQRSARTARRRS